MERYWQAKLDSLQADMVFLEKKQTQLDKEQQLLDKEDELSERQQEIESYEQEVRNGRFIEMFIRRRKILLRESWLMDTLRNFQNQRFSKFLEILIELKLIAED